MDDMCLYHIQLRGQVDEAEINPMSPLQLVREWGEPAVTQFSIYTDQSGLIGLTRHLHNSGFVLLGIQRFEVISKADNEHSAMAHP